MNFLAALGSKILEWFITKVWSWISDAVSKILRRKKIDEESADSVKPLKEAKTGAEIDKAADSALDRW